MSLQEETRFEISETKQSRSGLTTVEIINKLFTKFSIYESNELSKQFEGKKIPNISIKDYLGRIQHYLDIHYSTNIIALIYMERFCELNKLKLGLENFHRLYFVSLIIAIKFNEDECYGNNYYSKVGGIQVSAFNSLETLFLKNLNYSLYVSIENFDTFVDF